ncbi:hypothetical protein OROMI_033527 [Orobanche minor]
MELLPSQESDMPIPLNSTYGGVHVHGHMIHHHHHHHHQDHDPPSLPSSGVHAPISSILDDHEDDDEYEDDHDNYDHVVLPFKKRDVKYKECLKNHAASIGGNATDGCGEFMPSGEEGTLEAFTCLACNCHRNFHRKETEGDEPYDDYNNSNNNNNYNYSSIINSMSDNPRIGRKMFMGHHHMGYLGQDHAMGYPHHPLHVPPHHHRMIMSYNNTGGGGIGGYLPSGADEMEGNVRRGGGGGGGGVVVLPAQMAKKRFRTKFSQEQKEKMLSFAERVGWKIQKQEEGVVQQFCREIGVKRRVLKVWMHNNKHNIAKKSLQANSENQV